MDRIALSKRIGGLADVFASGNPIRRELEAMSYALEHMADEKFSSILNAGYEADKDARLMMPTGPQQKPQMSVSQRARAQSPDVPVFEPRDPKAALQALMSDPAVQQAVEKNPQLAKMVREAGVQFGADLEQPGNMWGREASEAVLRNLISDVLGKEAMEKAICCDTGRQLDKKQMPDAEKKQEKPATLTEPQTPKLSEALKSDMYKKSQGAVRKEAAKVDDAPAAEEPAPVEEAPKAEEAPVAEPKAKQVSEEKKVEKAEKTQELATDKAEQTADALKDLEKMTAKKASDESEAMVTFEGIELGSPMAEVELTAEDVATLGKLFG